MRLGFQVLIRSELTLFPRSVHLEIESLRLDLHLQNSAQKKLNIAETQNSQKSPTQKPENAATRNQKIMQKSPTQKPENAATRNPKIEITNVETQNSQKSQNAATRNQMQQLRTAQNSNPKNKNRATKKDKNPEHQPSKHLLINPENTNPQQKIFHRRTNLEKTENESRDKPNQKTQKTDL